MRFRPVSVDDAGFIVMLRNQPHAKGKIHDTSDCIDKQREWISSYLLRDNEYYWIFETLNGVPVGTTSLYNYDIEKNQIETGRWVTLANYKGTYSLSEEVLFKDFAFKVLGVSKVVCDVVSSNTQVMKYHKVILREKETGEISYLEGIGGGIEKMIWFEETSDSWEINRKRLIKFCGDENDRKIFMKDDNGVLKQIDYLHLNR